MIITIKTRSDEEIERCSYRQALEIDIDGKTMFSVYDGEPEDSNLSRDFSDCWNIEQMLVAAHAAGAKGEDLIIDSIEDDDI